MQAQEAASDVQILDRLLVPHLRTNSDIAHVAAQSLSASARAGVIWWAITAWRLRTGERTNRQAAVDGAIAWCLAQVVGKAVKQVVHRRRPTTGQGKQPSSPSMPSTHTTNAVAYAVAAGIRDPRTAVPLGALAATIGWSRLALNRHYPTDVVVGVALGGVVGVSVALAHRAYDTRSRSNEVTT